MITITLRRLLKNFINLIQYYNAQKSSKFLINNIMSTQKFYVIKIIYFESIRFIIKLID